MFYSKVPWTEDRFAEIVELKDHPWFLAVQFHPEFQSKPNQAHPLFAAFIAATLNLKRKGAKTRRKGAKA